MLFWLSVPFANYSNIGATIARSSPWLFKGLNGQLPSFLSSFMVAPTLETQRQSTHRGTLGLPHKLKRQVTNWRKC